MPSSKWRDIMNQAMGNRGEIHQQHTCILNIRTLLFSELIGEFHTPPIDTTVQYT